MKKLLLSLSIILITNFAFSQGVLQTGASQINIGLGFSNSGVPVYIGFDHCIVRDVTIGAELSYRNYNENWQNNYYDHNIVGVSGNANYHFNTLFNIPSRWDLYAGANVGFYFWTSPNEYNGSHNSGLGIGGQIGGRYYFTNKLGVNLEFGGGNAFSGGKIGLTFVL